MWALNIQKLYLTQSKGVMRQMESSELKNVKGFTCYSWLWKWKQVDISLGECVEELRIIVSQQYRYGNHCLRAIGTELGQQTWRSSKGVSSVEPPGRTQSWWNLDFHPVKLEQRTSWAMLREVIDDYCFKLLNLW